MDSEKMDGGTNAHRPARSCQAQAKFLSLSPSMLAWRPQVRNMYGFPSGKYGFVCSSMFKEWAGQLRWTPYALALRSPIPGKISSSRPEPRGARHP